MRGCIIRYFPPHLQDPISISGWPSGALDNTAFGINTAFSMGGGRNSWCG
jgi:hypothetical protein